MAKDIAIEVKNLSKHFRLPTEQSSSIKQAFINFTKGIKGYKEQRVLRNISFNVEKGDFFGIVGRNGSGKSTLLKLIAGIYQPDKGAIKINGSLVSFIELGVGFNPELTGRENIYLNGALMGFDKKQVDAMYDEIVEFAELGEFMDQKLKNYSSGMQVRLAFSCAIRAKSEILVLDEILAVGDEAFQRKCSDYFDRIKKDKNQTVILVTHSMDNVRKYCNKAMMIRDGKVVISGSPEDVANEYSLENANSSEIGTEEKEGNNSLIKNFGAKLLSAKQVDQNKEIRLKVFYETTEDIETYVIATIFDINRNVPLVDSHSKTQMSKKDTKIKQVMSIKLNEINDAGLRINIQLRNNNNETIAYLPESKTPMFILRRTDYPKTGKKLKLGILFKYGDWR